MAGPIRIAVLADSRGAVANINRTAASVEKMGKRVAAGAAIAGVALAGLGIATVKSAAEAEQSIGATEQVFGKMAARIIKESNRAANNFGLTANQYRTNANLIGASVTGMGIPLNRATVLTQDLVARGADLAATFGGTTEEAVSSLGSAFRGEFDPLERYGLSLKQSEVSALLASRGQDKLTGAAQKAATATATYDLIMQRSAKSQGQFSRESNTFSGQMQRLTAQLGNLRDRVGMAVLPVLTKVVGFISGTALPAFKAWASEMGDRLAPVFARIGAAVQDLMKRLQPLGDWLSDHPEIIKGVGIALGIAAAAAAVFAVAMGAVALATSPITLTVLAIAALGGAVAYAYKNSQTFRDGLAAVGQIAQQLFAWLQANVGPVLASLGDLFVAQAARWQAAIQVALQVIQSLWATFGATILAFLQATWSNVQTVVQGALTAVQGVIQVVTGLIKGDWSKVWKGIQNIVSGVWGVIKGLVSQGINVVRSVLSAGWAAVKATTTAAWEGVKAAVREGIRKVVDLATGLPGKIAGAIGNLAELLVQAGRDVIAGLRRGIEEKWGEVKDFVAGIGDKVAGAFKGALGIESPSKVMRKIGQFVMDGLRLGILDGEGGVTTVIEGVNDRITKVLDKRYDGKKLKRHSAAVKKALADEYASAQAIGRQMDDLQSGNYLKYLSTASGLYKDMTAAGVTNLAQARDLFAKLKQDAADYTRTISESIRATGNITQLGRQADGTVSVTSLINELEDKVLRAENFQAKIEELAKLGLSEESINQILAAGPEAALATATAIEEGGAESVKKINELNVKLAAQGDALGVSMAARYKNAGVAMAAGMVSGLESQMAVVEAAAVAMATTLTKAVKKALKIKSPSKVFAGIGDNVVKGLDIGLDNTYVKASGTRMAASLERGFGTPALEAYARGGGAGGTQRLEIRLSAETVSRLTRGAEIQKDLDYARSNGVRGTTF